MTETRLHSEAVLDGRFGANGSAIRSDDRGQLPQSPGEYVSPYGRIDGLAKRLADLQRRLAQPGSGLPYYGGLIKDLEVVVRLLNLREFAEHLRTHGNDEQLRWASEILELLDEGEQVETLYDDIERVLPVAEGQEYAEAVSIAARKAVKHDAIRAVLVQLGALAPDDTTTNVPDLLRALLS